MDLLAQGLSNTEIAATLKISARTVEVHRMHMRLKLQAKTVGDVVRIAIHAALAERD